MENLNYSVDHTDDVISPEFRFYYDLWFIVMATSGLAIFSIVCNIINIATFFRQGLKERVNFTLFCLSISDFFLAVFVLGFADSFVPGVWNLKPFIDPEVFIFVFGWMRNLFIDMTAALTVFISVERCACVASPFTFNSSFIARNARTIVVCIMAFVVINYVPMLGTVNLVPNVLSDNSTTLTLIYTDQLNLAIGKYNDILFGVTLAVICQGCVLCCAVIMYRGLRKSSEFRRSTAVVCKDVSVEEEKHTQGLPRKESRIVRLVLMLACLYIPTSLPQMVFCTARIVVPGFGDGSMEKLYLTTGGAMLFLGLMNGAFSIFIYFNFSTSYRNALLRFCGAQYIEGRRGNHCSIY